MSASASKKKRKEQLLAPLPEKKDEKKTGKKILIGVIAAIVALALIVAVGMLIKSNDYKVDYDTKQAAMTVGDYEVSVPMFNYFYTSTLNNYVNSGYLNYGLIQQSVPLSQQTYMGSFGNEDGPTWEAQLIDETKTQISNTVNLYLAAKEAGHTLTDDDKAAIEEKVKSVKKSAKDNGYNFFGLTTNWFLSDYFGKGCNLDNYREFVELTQFCQSYAEAKEADFLPSADDIKAEYAENPNDYDLVTYALYTVNAEADGKDENEADTYSDEAIAAAKADADAAAKDFPADATVATKGYDNVTSGINEDAAKWLFDASRKDGDISVFESAEGRTFYVVRFDGRDVNDYNLANAYVLSFAFDAEGAEPAEGELSAAEKFAKLSDGVKDGISEEDFAALAEKYGFTASASPVDRHALNEKVTSFLYDSARKDGDILTLEDADSSTYYVVRFVSFAEKTYQEQIVENALHEEAESSWLNEVYAANTADMNADAIAFANTDRTFG